MVFTRETQFKTSKSTSTPLEIQPEMQIAVIEK